MEGKGEKVKDWQDWLILNSEGPECRGGGCVFMLTAGLYSSAWNNRAEWDQSHCVRETTKMG